MWVGFAFKWGNLPPIPAVAVASSYTLALDKLPSALNCDGHTIWVVCPLSKRLLFASCEHASLKDVFSTGTSYSVIVWKCFRFRRCLYVCPLVMPPPYLVIATSISLFFSLFPLFPLFGDLKFAKYYYCLVSTFWVSFLPPYLFGCNTPF